MTRSPGVDVERRADVVHDGPRARSLQLDALRPGLQRMGWTSVDLPGRRDSRASAWLRVAEDQRAVVERPEADHLPVPRVVLWIDPRLPVSLLREAMHHALHVARREPVDPRASRHVPVALAQAWRH